MSTEGEVTRWLSRLKEGDRSAVQELWQRYFIRLVGLARQRLGGASRRVVDEEDVALSAFDSFIRRAGEGRFPRLDDRDDLWQVLVMITVRKAADQVNRELRQKRGGGAVKAASELGDEGAVFADLISREPDPGHAAEVAEGCQRLLDALGDGSLRAVAVAKMEGHTNEEIAIQLSISLVGVERKLRRCRGILVNCLVAQ
jgi:DNA-directed RNA polymerase specialized sigma24 family protein